ncbi:hypothetical protein L227DRAFT_67279 [Lentinus tigrinus ALCF2SS1-6]|uniref:Uncharacterized protein n=1 Tax=Lentinus tigrinus ALCF2SS1-6 TaxID=1328759 RepID=A0A5C2SC51_9APHY|nr:hypothetical protein L227DRAFT_67279 [Lentinus tigrinus ALCF2SS1-6]
MKCVLFGHERSSMLTLYAQLPPQARVEAMRRIRMLNTVTSAFPVPQGFPSYPMEHGQRAGAYGPPPNHPYQTYNCTAAQSLPPTMFPHGAMPPIGVPCLGMNSAAWSQSVNFNLGYNSFAGPVPEYAPDYVLNGMGPIPEPGPSFSRTVPWSSNEGCDTDHAIHILDSPAQAPMFLYDPLDVSSIPSVVPAVGVCESQPAIVTSIQSMRSDAVPELSNTDLAELASFVLTRIESSPVPASSSLGFTSAEDPPTQDPLETLPHDHIWPQELDDWMGVPSAAA